MNEMGNVEKRLKNEVKMMENRMDKKMKKMESNIEKKIKDTVKGLRYEVKAKLVLDNHFSRGFDVSTQLKSQNYKKEFGNAQTELQKRGWDAKINKLFPKEQHLINSHTKSIEVDFVKKETGPNSQSFLAEATNSLNPERLIFKLFQLERAIVYWNCCHPTSPVKTCGLVSETGCDNEVLDAAIKDNRDWLVNVGQMYMNSSFRLIISE